MFRGKPTITYTLGLCCFLVLTTALTACDPEPPSLNPSIANVTVGDTVQAVPPEIAVTVTVPGASNKRVHRVTAEFRSTLEPDRPFIFTDGDFSGNNNIWTGHLPALNLGPYEARVTVVLRPGPNPDGSINPPIDETHTSNIVAFNVGPDAVECFDFAAVQDNTQGWTHSGYFLVPGDQPTTGCSEELFWFGSALFAGFGPNCLPDEQFRLDMVSPNVSGRPGWAQTQGSVFSVGWNIPGMLIQPILGRADGLNSIAPVDSNGDFIFYPHTGVTGSVLQFRIPITITEGTVDNFRLRFFGAPMSVGAEGFAKIVFACPIPERPG